LCLPSDKFVKKDGWQWLEKDEILSLPLHRLMEKMIRFT
jgi:hypothetical protein